MIILDTNVVSEPLRNLPDGRVEDWMARQQASAMFITAISIAEILAAIAIMPDGRRKELKADKTEASLTRLFGERILVFDAESARGYANIFASTRIRGRGITDFDCQIAAIALRHGMTIASRDTQPFIDAGLDVINPWEAG